MVFRAVKKKVFADLEGVVGPDLLPEKGADRVVQLDTLIQVSDHGGEASAPKQAHLIRSAYKVMGEKRLGRLALRDSADAAGVSKAILPYYFESKENLILLMMRWVLARCSADPRGCNRRPRPRRRAVYAVDPG